MTSKPTGQRRDSGFLSMLARLLYMMTILCLPCVIAKGTLEKRMNPGPKRLPVHLAKRMTQVEHITQPLLYEPINGQRAGAELPEDYAIGKKASQTATKKHDELEIKIEDVPWHAPETYKHKKPIQSGNPSAGTRIAPTEEQSVSVNEVRRDQALYLPEWALEEDIKAFRKWLDKRFGRKFKKSESRYFTNSRMQKDQMRVDVYMNSARRKWNYKRPQVPYGPPQYPYKDPHYYFNKWWNIHNRRIECYGNYWKLFKVGLKEALTAARKSIKYFFRRLEWFWRTGK